MICLNIFRHAHFLLGKESLEASHMHYLGYTFLLIAMFRKVFPATAPLTLATAFFVSLHRMEKIPNADADMFSYGKPISAAPT